MEHDDDPRVVLTLDAGGTNLKFTAIRGNALLLEPIYVPSEARDLDRCLANVIEGFRRVESLLPARPVALSFAFPRLLSRAYNFADPAQAREFVAGDARTLRVPGSGRTVTHDPAIRSAVGVSLKTSESVAIGAYAYAFALQRLDAGKIPLTFVPDSA